MMKNKLAAIIPAALLAMSLAACGTSTTGAPAEKPAAETAGIEEEVQQGATTEETVPAASETTAAAVESASETATETAAAAETAAASATVAAAAEETVQYMNGEMVLSVPARYNDLLIIDTLSNDQDGILFNVSEKASVEAAQAQGEDQEGAGWLFSIGTTDESTVHDKLCEDMSGEDVFARKEDGTYFIKYHPTDVRFVRDNYEDIDEDMEQWGELNEWAATVPDTFVEENEGLIPEKHSNTSLDMYFARIAYRNDKNYTLASLEHGVWGPADVDPAPHLEKLNGITFEYADDEEAPDGEYVVFTVPEENVRYDFFFAEPGQNYVREVRDIDGEEYEILYKADVPEGSPTLNEIMNEWYLDVVNNGGEAIDAH